jgi:hypothetical protein
VKGVRLKISGKPECDACARELLLSTGPMKSGLMRFLLKLSLLGIPFILLMGGILLMDPFRVIYRYNFGDYYNEQPYELNRDYVSTEMLLARVRQSSPPNAFIFGSSRSFSYRCETMQRYVSGGRCFHYPAASENLFGIYSKIRLIDRLNVKLDHALVVLDYSAFGIENRKDHLHILHPEETQDGWVDYQMAFVKASFSRFFILKYLDYKLFGKVRPYMSDIFQIKPGTVRIDPLTNDYFFEAEEQQLAADAERFYRERAQLFPPRTARPPVYAKPAIGEVQRQYLLEMKSVFDKYQTNYRIVVSPLYDQVSLNRADLAALEEVFGKDRVFDYSGANQITREMRNFYDAGHYRPFVADDIMREIYTK